MLGKIQADKRSHESIKRDFVCTPGSFRNFKYVKIFM